MKIRELVVEKEAAHHLAVAEGGLDARGQRYRVSVGIDHRDVRGRRKLEGLGQTVPRRDSRGIARVRLPHGALRVDQFERAST